MGPSYFFSHRRTNAQLQAFYEANHDALYRYAFWLLRSHILTEEAVQESWAKCVQNRRTFFSLSPSERLPWMVVVVRHTALDLLRRERRCQPLDPDWDTKAPEEQGVGEVLAIIREMPPKYCVILELKFVYEWQDEAIAQHLHLPLSTVTSRVQRGRKMLQAKLLQEGCAP